MIELATLNFVKHIVLSVILVVQQGTLLEDLDSLED